MTDNQTLSIELESPETGDSRALIVQLTAELEPLYPREFRHGYSVERMVAEGVHFFVMREGGRPVGCGGVQFFGDEYGELKRMFVRPAFRGRGYARRLLAHLEAFARERGVPLLRLETGNVQHAAIALYERNGFVRVPAFGDYRPTEINLFFEKKIGERGLGAGDLGLGERPLSR